MLFETSRLKIRALTLTDVNDFHSYRSEPTVVEFQGFDVMNLMQVEAFISSLPKTPFGQTSEWMQYGIELKSSGKIIGDCGIQLSNGEAPQAELGITISHHFQNQGYAKEAIQAWLQFIFEEKKIHRVVCITDVNNTACVNLLKSCGFRQEGHFIENVFLKGRWASEYQFAKLRREWKR